MSYLCFAPFGPAVSVSSTCFRGGFETILPCAVSPVYATLSCCGEEEGIHIVTGGNRGVGYHTARILLQQNKRVMILSRSVSNGEEAVRQLQASTGNSKIEFDTVDLGDLNTVLAFVKRMENRNIPIVSLVNNAGIIAHNAVEVNHVGHFALTLSLLPYLQLSVQRNGYANVVNVASCANWEGSFALNSHIDRLADPTIHTSGGVWSTYAASKAANVLFTHSLARCLKSRGIGVSSYHPGVMLTDLWRDQHSQQNTNATQQHVPQHNMQITTTTATTTGGNASINSTAKQGLDSGDMLRMLTFCCVKHPMMSAVGLSALATPCCTCLPVRHCFPHTEHGSVSCADMICSVFAGSSGGYFQQCMCCSVLPVRPSPMLNNTNTQALLWANSLKYVSREHAVFYEYVQSVLTKYDARLLNSSESGECNVLVSPAWPCMECLSAGPYCVCVACLC